MVTIHQGGTKVPAAVTTAHKLHSLSFMAPPLVSYFAVPAKYARYFGQL